MRGYPGRKAVAVATPAKKIRMAQEARNQIRELTALLPDDEATSLIQHLIRSEQAIRRRKEKQLQHSLTWSKFPPEIRNMIYDLLLVQDEPIVAAATYAGHWQKQSFNRYDLGANFLAAGKEVLKEGLPILLGRNTFEVTPDFHFILGSNRRARMERGKLVKTIIVPCDPQEREFRSFGKLIQLEECIIVSPSSFNFGFLGWNPTEAELEAEAFVSFELAVRTVRPAGLALKALISKNTKVNFYYLYEGDINGRNDGNNTVGVRLKIWYADILQNGGSGFAYEKIAVNYYKNSAARNMPLV